MSDNELNKIKKNYKTIEIIEAVIRFSGLNTAQFLKKIGVGQTFVQDIKNGKTKSISRNVAEKITSQWPEISENFLLMGCGPMLKNGDGSTQINGNNNLNSGSITNTLDERLLKMLEDSHKMMTENQKERLRLLTIIENLIMQGDEKRQ